MTCEDPPVHKDLHKDLFVSPKSEVLGPQLIEDPEAAGDQTATEEATVAAVSAETAMDDGEESPAGMPSDASTAVELSPEPCRLRTL